MRKPPPTDPLVTRAQAAEAARHRIADIRRRMDAIGLGQRALADRCKIQQPHINRVLRGHVAVPTYWTLLKLEQGVEYFERQVAARRRKG
jgi:predicted transcriptional regulator